MPSLTKSDIPSLRDVSDIVYILFMAFVVALQDTRLLRLRTVPVWIAGLVAILFVGTVVAIMVSGGASFGFMRLCAWTGFAAVPVYLFLSARIIRPPWRWLSLAGCLGIILMGIDAFLIEPHWLSIRHYSVPAPTLAQALRVVVLADIQTDAVGDYERDVLLKARDLKPDLLLFPGDFVQAYPKDQPVEFARFTALLNEIGFSPRLGSYAVDGDVEEPGWEIQFKDTGIHTLTKMTVTNLGEVELIGLPLWASRSNEIKLPPRTGYRIAFGHAPDFSLTDIDADLLLAGHTHGGQVRMPFFGPLVTLSAVPRDWADGDLIPLPDGRHLIVSKGIGMERGGAPPLRFNCRPEIVVVDLVPTTNP